MSPEVLPACAAALVALGDKRLPSRKGAYYRLIMNGLPPVAEKGALSFMELTDRRTVLTGTGKVATILTI